MPPGSLAVGQHTLGVQMSFDPVGPVFTNTISFLIDPAGSSACA